VIYDRLRAYCAKLVDQPVRGRTPGNLADTPPRARRCMPSSRTS